MNFHPDTEVHHLRMANGEACIMKSKNVNFYFMCFQVRYFQWSYKNLIPGCWDADTTLPEIIAVALEVRLERPQTQTETCGDKDF